MAPSSFAVAVLVVGESCIAMSSVPAGKGAAPQSTMSTTTAPQVRVIASSPPKPKPAGSTASAIDSESVPPTTARSPAAIVRLLNVSRCSLRR